MATINKNFIVKNGLDVQDEITSGGDITTSGKLKYKFPNEKFVTINVIQPDDDTILDLTGSGTIALTSEIVNYDLTAVDSGTAGTAYIRLSASGGDTSVDDVSIVAGTNVNVQQQAGNQIVISSTDTTYTAGNGLALSGTDFSLDFTELTDMIADVTSNTEIIVQDGDATAASRKSINEIKLSAFNNDLGNYGGFLTAESDTLATVTGRGASTSSAISITNTTASTSTSTGALTVNGGLGVTGAIYAGKQSTIEYDYSLAYPTGYSNLLTLKNTNTTSDSVAFGMRTSAGGTGSVAKIVDFINTDGTFAVRTSSASNGTAVESFTASNTAFTIQPTTDSTGTSNGALVVKGGVGVAKTLRVGSTTDSTTTTTGSIITLGGIGVAKNIVAGGRGTFKTLVVQGNGGVGTSAYIQGGDLEIDSGQNIYFGTTFPTYISGSDGTSGTMSFIVGNAGTALKLMRNDSSSGSQISKIILGSDTGDANAISVIEGNQTIWIDPAPAAGDAGGTVVIKGNLQVDGTTTTLNSTTLDIDDLNITLAKGAVDSAAANGAGITVDGANASITYDATYDSWAFNKDVIFYGNIKGATYQTGDYTTEGEISNYGYLLTSGEINIANDTDYAVLSFQGSAATIQYDYNTDTLEFLNSGTNGSFDFWAPAVFKFDVTANNISSNTVTTSTANTTTLNATTGNITTVNATTVNATTINGIGVVPKTTVDPNLTWSATGYLGDNAFIINVGDTQPAANTYDLWFTTLSEAAEWVNTHAVAGIDENTYFGANLPTQIGILLQAQTHVTDQVRFQNVESTLYLIGLGATWEDTTIGDNLQFHSCQHVRLDNFNGARNRLICLGSIIHSAKYMSGTRLGRWKVELYESYFYQNSGAIEEVNLLMRQGSVWSGYANVTLYGQNYVEQGSSFITEGNLTIAERPNNASAAYISLWVETGGRVVVGGDLNLDTALPSNSVSVKDDDPMFLLRDTGRIFVKSTINYINSTKAITAGKACVTYNDDGAHYFDYGTEAFGNVGFILGSDITRYYNNNGISFGTNSNNTNAASLVVADTGNVWVNNNFGIGTSAPATALDVDGSISVSGTTVIDSNRNLTNIGTINGSTISNWDTAYTYSQVGHLPLAGGTLTGDLVISKTNPRIRLYEPNTTTGNYPSIEFDTDNNQGLALTFNEFDAELNLAGYGLVLGPSSTNVQHPSTGDISLNVLGEIFAGGETLGSLNKVFHDGYHPNADKWTTARTNTVTLTGDVTGSGNASVDGSGNWTVSIPTVVGNDSHNHNHSDGDFTVNGKLFVDQINCRTDQDLTITTGEADSVMSEASFNDEIIRLAGEGGVKVYASSDNLTSGLNRETTLIDSTGNMTIGQDLIVNGGNITATNIGELVNSSANWNQLKVYTQDTPIGIAEINVYESDQTTWIGGLSYGRSNPSSFAIQTNLANLDVWVNGSTVGTFTNNSLSINGTIKIKGASYDTTIDAANPTANRTITLPDASGTVALLSDITSVAESDTLDTVTTRGNTTTNTVGVGKLEVGTTVEVWNDVIRMRDFTSAPKVEIYGGSGDANFAGLLTATQKSFTIDHPTKEGYKLRYGSLEGPENGVYVRGRLQGTNVIELPDYWVGLVHEDSITVQLTANGRFQKLYVKDIKDNKVIVGNGSWFSNNTDCFYVVYGERKDVDKLTVEFEV